MEEKNKEIWEAEVRGVLIETTKGKRVLINMSDEVVELLFGK